MDRRKLRVENGDVLIRGCVLTFVFFVLFFNSFAQNYIQYTTDNGVPSAELYNVLQNDEGFMFITSVDGLIRFDGDHFKLYDVEDGLTDNDVVVSCMDKLGRVWLSTFNGTVCIYDNGKIITSSTNKLLKKVNQWLDRSDYASLGRSESGMIILYTKANGNFLTVNDTLITEYHTNSVRINSVSEIDKILYINNRKGTIRMNLEGEIVDKKPSEKSLGLIYKKDSSVFTIDNTAGRQSVLVWDFEDFISSVPREYKLPPGQSSTCNALTFKDNRVFFAQNDGVYSADFNLLNIKRFHKFPVATQVRGLFTDRQNNLWVVTYHNGIYLFPKTYGESELMDEEGNFNSFCVFNKESCLAALGAESLLIQDGKKSFRFPIEKCSQFEKIKSNTEQIYTYRSNDILLTIDIDTKKSRKYYVPNNNGTIKDFSLKKDFFAFSTSEGYSFGRLKESLQYRQGRTTAIQIGHNLDVIYLGGLDGVYEIRLRNGTWKHKKLHDSLNRHVISLDLDPQGVLWIQEQNQVRAYFDNKIQTKLNVTSGLVSKTINGMNLGMDKIVIATNSGVSIVHYKLENGGVQIISIDNYSKENGLFADYCSNAAICQNKLVMQTPFGIMECNIFKKEDTNLYKPEIIEFRANEKLISLDSLILTYKQRFISIDFASLVYGSTPSSYSYRLVQQGERWQTTVNRKCDFQDLSPGEYLFQLRANYRDGNVYGPVEELSFYIKPAFWQTLWFKVLIFLLAALLLFYIIYTFWQRRKMSLEAERNFAQLKMQALKAQMNPHFIFNSLNSIQSIVNNGEVELANEYIVQFSTLIRQSLNYSNIDYITVKDEVDFLHNYIQLEQLRFENIFAYSIVVSDDINSSETLLPPMMLQIYVENAIRHGIVPLKNGGFVSVLFELEGEYLKCSIEDNGVGRKEEKINKNKIYTSRGTQLNEERAEMYQTILEKEIFITWTDKLDKAKNRKGTKVQIKIPII